MTAMTRERVNGSIIVKKIPDNFPRNVPDRYYEPKIPRFSLSRYQRYTIRIIKEGGRGEEKKKIRGESKILLLTTTGP